MLDPTGTKIREKTPERRRSDTESRSSDSRRKSGGRPGSGRRSSTGTGGESFSGKDSDRNRRHKKLVKERSHKDKDSDHDDRISEAKSNAQRPDESARNNEEPMHVDSVSNLSINDDECLLNLAGGTLSALSVVVPNNIGSLHMQSSQTPEGQESEKNQAR